MYLLPAVRLPTSVLAPGRSGRGCRFSTIRHPLGLRLFHGRSTATLPQELLPALHERLGRLFQGVCRMALNVDISVRHPRPMASRRICAVARGGTGDGIPRLDLRWLRPHPWGRSRIRGNILDNSPPNPDLGRLRSGLWRGRRIRAGIIMQSGLSCFDPPLLHPLPREWSSTGAALPGGNSFPCLDPGTLPWG